MCSQAKMFEIKLCMSTSDYLSIAWYNQSAKQSWHNIIIIIIFLYYLLCILEMSLKKVPLSSSGLLITVWLVQSCASWLVDRSTHS